MKKDLRIPLFLLICILTSVVSGCEMTTGNVRPSDDKRISEMDRSITDLGDKVAELTREVAELSERVGRDETALDAYVSGSAHKQVQEEILDKNELPAGGAAPSSDKSGPPAEKEGKGTPAAPSEVKGTSPNDTKSAAPKDGDVSTVGGTTPTKDLTPKDAQVLYDAALGEIMGRKAEAALPLFQKFVTTYPNDELTDNAYYWIGECYYLTGDYHKAFNNFKKVKDSFPGRDKVPDALLKMGYCDEKLGDTTEALAAYAELIKTYPDTPAAGLARERIK